MKNRLPLIATLLLLASCEQKPSEIITLDVEDSISKTTQTDFNLNAIAKEIEYIPLKRAKHLSVQI